MTQETVEELAFQLKGSMYTLTLLQLINPDRELVKKQLISVINQAPKLFQNAPIILDLGRLAAEHVSSLVLLDLVTLLREHLFFPIGIIGANPEHHAQATHIGLAPLNPKSSKENIHQETVVAQKEDKEEIAPPSNQSMLITQPVRSGQQIYAKNTDLVVIGPVSHGAELLADGHIHIYGTLRGKALAGINGNTKARIFCQRLEAELVAIAGAFQLSENFGAKFGSKNLQIYLDNDQLQIEPLEV